MSGSNVQVDVSGQAPSAPVGGTDPLGPLTTAIDNLHAVLVSVKEAVDKIDIGGAIKGPLSNELTAFNSKFENVLTQFTTKFINQLDTLLSNIKVTATGGGGSGGGGRRGGKGRSVIEEAERRDAIDTFENKVRLERETQEYSKGTLNQPWRPPGLDTGPSGYIHPDTGLWIPGQGPHSTGDYATVKPKLLSRIPQVPMHMRSKEARFDAFIAKQQERKEFKDLAISKGLMPGPLSKLDTQVKTVEEEVKDLLTKAQRKQQVNKLYNEQAAGMGLPPRGPNKPTTAGAGGFDWKKLLGAAGLGFAFTGGAGIAAAAIVKLLPKVVKAFEPVIDLGNALVDSLDPLAETVNSALTPFRDLANQLKRFSVLGGFGASFNMNRINAQFESNLNDLMGSMLETVSSIFSNPLAGIMNAASMIGKFVDMVDPAAMALFQQTMRDTFAVIGTALRPAMFELSKMLRSFADHLHPVLQEAMPRIMSGLQSLAEAFERNIPLITLMIEKFVGDFTKQIDKSGSLFEDALDPKKLMKDFENYQKGIKVKDETSASEKAFERFFYRTDREFELKKGFQSTANLILKLAGKEGGIEKNKEFLASFLKSIVDKTKPPSTVGLARVTDAAYGGVAEVGREAVRRAFEGSRLQDLQRQNNREDIETATYNAFIKALDQWAARGKIYETAPTPNPYLQGGGGRFPLPVPE